VREAAISIPLRFPRDTLCLNCLAHRYLIAKMLTRKSSAKRKAAPLPPGEALGRELSAAVVLFHEAVAAQLGMSATEWRCLSLLSQQGPATAGRLAQLSGFTTGAITGIVDRLERAGYARREPHRGHPKRGVG
jgi:hypothetical protein